VIQKYLLAILLMFSTLPAFGQDLTEALVGRSIPPRTSVDFLRYSREVQTALLAACPLSRATTYYISPTGSDAAAGSFAAPWLTVDKVNDMLRDNVITNTAFLFADNGVWGEDVGIEVEADDDNNSIGSYGSGRSPLIHAFTTVFATGGTLWTDAGAGTAHYATMATAPGGVRIRSDRYRILRKVADATECGNTLKCWFWTSASGGRLYVHLTTTPTTSTAYDPDNATYGGVECTLASMTDDDGIIIMPGATGIRIDGVVCDGWGFDGGEVNQKYGIKSCATNSDRHLITNCGAFYNARHNMGHYDTEGGGTGVDGLVGWADIYCGGVTEDSGVPLVFYAAQGGYEDWVFNVEVSIGSLPLSATRVTAEGAPVICHTNSSFSPGFVCVMNARMPKHPQGFGCHSNVILADFHLNGDVTPDTCRGVTINEWLEEAEGTGSGGLSSGSVILTSSPPLTGTVAISPKWNFKPTNNTQESLCVSGTAGRASGWWINPEIFVNLGVNWTANYCGLINGADSANATQCKLWGGTLKVLNKVNKHFFIFYDGLGDNETWVPRVDGSEIVNMAGGMIRNDNSALTNPLFHTGLRNTAIYQRQNAWFGISANGTLIGVSNTPGLIALASPPIFGVGPALSSALVGGGEVLNAYDNSLQLRSMSGPTIGASEYLPASSFGTTPAEAADAIRIELATELSRIDVATSTRNSTTPPTANAIADAVFDEPITGHDIVQSFGKQILDTLSEATSASGSSAVAASAAGDAKTRVELALPAVEPGEENGLPLTSDVAAVGDAVEDVQATPDTRDLDDVQHVWILRRSGTGALQSITEPQDSTLYVYPGDTDVRVGWDCNIPSILPNGTVLATMSEPESDNDDLTLTKLGIGPNGLRAPVMLAKVSIDVAADATPGSYWITTQVTNRLGGGPMTLYGKVTILSPP
jgi:hypothetical protein